MITTVNKAWGNVIKYHSIHTLYFTLSKIIILVSYDSERKGKEKVVPSQTVNTYNHVIRKTCFLP